ncbi:uroporphyrinogen-III C-methyltransferase [Shewanella yunxiaonensis]|uniref:Uroporphyrinogen-III C-methyltransferase n=1 Tax=Shewanella yunxiaonensis TaxID=2829809 RepID=A0ABX7YV76_9GAMM|nr:uroporphyrinogen-III C-methyltransferase [Shewanella yunxiaonensis]QUN06199.1 uroporphyrinogen-III C-methyltransferase [Shewanella yunxiaonensis]
MDNEKPEVERNMSAESDLPQPETEVISPAPATERTPKANSSLALRLVVLITFVIAVLACVGSGYLYWQLQLQSQQTSSMATSMQQALQAPENELRQLAQQLQQSQQASANQQTTIEALLQSDQQLQSKIATLAQRHPNHWLAAEAEYLVRIAGRKLWLEKDPQTAVGLLQAADERIAAMQEPSLVPLRKALAQDIANVQDIKTVDIAGTVFTLDGIIGKLDKMPLHQLGQHEQTADENSQQMSDSVSDWKSNLAKTWKALTEDFFTIRKINTDITPLLSPKQEWYLEENIRNKLLQAQLALYQYNALNYRQSITMARKWIQQYYDLEDEHTQEVLQALQALVNLTLDPINVQQFQCSAQLKQLVTYGKLVPATEAEQ